MSDVLGRRFWAQRPAVVGVTVLVSLAALSLLAPLIAPQNPSDPLGFDPLAANHPPVLSWTFLLGADGRGRSVLALLLWGGRISLPIGLGSALAAALVGAVMGMLCCWHSDLLDPLLSFLMDLCQAAPPLLVLLLLAAALNGVPAWLLIATFAGTGWVAPARITRAAVRVTRTAPYVEAARSVGVGGIRLAIGHLLPAALAPIAAWTAASSAIYVALEAALDFLGLGLPADVTSWGTMLAGAQEALALGNWWWIVFGGAALALCTLALGAVARGMTAAQDPTHPVLNTVRHAAVYAEEQGADPGLGELWGAWNAPWRPARRGRSLPWGGVAAIAGTLLIVPLIGAALAHRDTRHVPQAVTLVRQASAYRLQNGQRHAYLATVAYAAKDTILAGRTLPWAARGVCPATLGGGHCGQSTVQLFFSDGRARAVTEGLAFVCSRGHTWGVNPMAGLARTDARGCTALGPDMDGLGATAGIIGALLPALSDVHARVLRSDNVAGRPCWVVVFALSGRACLDAASGLALRIERLDRHGYPVAACEVTEISYGLDLAAELFANPIPGGHGPLISGLTQPLLNLQAADDQALFFALVPSELPAGLSAQTPTFDQFNDDRRGYALAQRVRQVYQDSRGRPALVLIETLAGSAWDATPPAAARLVSIEGRQLQVWAHEKSRIVTVRRVVDGTAVLVSSTALPAISLERVAAGMQ